MTKQFTEIVRAQAYKRLLDGDVVGFKFYLLLLGQRYEKGMLIHEVV